MQTRAVRALGSLLGWTCVLIFVALLLVVLWQVVSRYALASPSSASEELARVLLMWLGLLGACYAHSQDQHIAIRLFTGLPAGVNAVRDQLITMACQTFSLVLLVGGAKLCWTTFELDQRTPVMDLPVGLVYSVLPLAGLLLTVFTSLTFWHQTTRESGTS